MFCVHCGREIPNDSVFCIHCGKSVAIQEENPIHTTENVHNEYTHKDTEQTVIENTQTKSSDSALDGLREAFTAGRELLEIDAEQRSDISCPFCGSDDCQPLQKSMTEVNHKGYGWGSGCCGLILLGPFGLLCGLCGAGSKVKTTNELWWVCRNCGKQHISLEDALKKWDTIVTGLPGSGLAGGILFLIFGWLDLNLISFLAQVFSVFTPVIGLYSMYKEISEELGETLILYLTPDQKKNSLTMLCLSIVIVILVGLLAIPLLNMFLGE